METIFKTKVEFVKYMKSEVLPLVLTYDKDYMLELFGMIEVLYWVDGFRHPALKNSYNTKEEFANHLRTFLPVDDELQEPSLCPSFIKECICWLNKD